MHWMEDESRCVMNPSEGERKNTREICNCFQVHALN